MWEAGLRDELSGLEHMRKREKLAIILAIICGFIIIFPATYFAGMLGLEMLSIFISAAGGWGVYFILKPKGYHSHYKEKIISVLIGKTKYKWAYDFSYTNAQEIFIQSGLYYSSITSFKTDDTFSAQNGADLRMAEIEAVRGRGKNRQVIFKGLLFSFDISRIFRGETYIRSNKGMGFVIPMGTKSSRTFFSSTVKSTDLEWNDFEKLLDVQTTDEIEAREILDPQFMHILYEWWKDHKKLMRISFRGQHVYVAIPSWKDMFEPSPFSSVESHKKRLWTYLDAFLLAERLFVQIEHKYGK